MVGLRAARQWVAACACVWLLACGLLTAHHVASQPHAIDASGAVVHAAPSPATRAEARGGHDRAEVRQGLDHGGDHGPCLMAHHAGSPTALAPSDGLDRSLAYVRQETASASRTHATAQLYLLAPKTSPPPGR